VLASMQGLSPEQQAVADGMFEMVTAIVKNTIEPMRRAWDHHQPYYVSTVEILRRMQR
jgi:hypothetical protein